MPQNVYDMIKQYIVLLWGGVYLHPCLPYLNFNKKSKMILNKITAVFSGISTRETSKSTYPDHMILLRFLRDFKNFTLISRFLCWYMELQYSKRKLYNVNKIIRSIYLPIDTIIPDLYFLS